MKTEVKKIDELLPDPNNINRHTQRGHGLVENSIRRRGVGRGILAAGKNTEKPVIMAGNLTHEKARDAGIEEVVFVHTTGNQLVVNVRDDLDPTSPEAIALGIEDNESGKLSYNPDIDLLAAMSAGDNGVLSKLKEDDKIFGDILQGMMNSPQILSEDEAFSGLPSEDRAPFQQMTFTLHDEQAETVREALKLSKGMGAFTDSPNENSNGNALARICETFITEHGNS